MLNIARGAALQNLGKPDDLLLPGGLQPVRQSNNPRLPIIFLVSALLVVWGMSSSRDRIRPPDLRHRNNEEAVRLSGHNTRFYKITAFVLCGGMVGIAAILYMLRLNIASPILGVGFELNAIAAVVIGARA
jgi:ribose transport system permease protein